jgi:hypothetical protein
MCGYLTLGHQWWSWVVSLRWALGCCTWVGNAPVGWEAVHSGQSGQEWRWGIFGVVIVNVGAVMAVAIVVIMWVGGKGGGAMVVAVIVVQW